MSGAGGTRLYLVTGFLGAGKTSFLKNLLTMLAPARLQVIVNEFGREGVDGKLLAELGAAVREINNGSVFCSCRSDQFEQALTEALQTHPDGIVVEASGLADPTHMPDILARPAFAGIDYRGAICVVDAVRFEKTFSTARMCKKQLAAGSTILLNKVDLATPEQLEQVRALLRAQRPDAHILETTFGQIRPEWWEELEHPTPRIGGEGLNTADITLQKYLIRLTDDFPKDRLVHFLKLFLEETYRVKGFVRLDGRIWLANCVGGMVELTPHDAVAEPGGLVVLSGGGMAAGRAIEEARALYARYVLAVERG